MVGDVLVEEHAEWTERRRHLGVELLKKARLTIIPGTTEQEELTALTA